MTGTERPHQFLGKLVGEWELTGQMGQVPLKQAVEAKWTLGGLFVEMYFRSLLPPPDGRRLYEAVYFIGYNEESDLYIMHLLDTFGVALACHVGTGRRDGDAIPFIFPYDGGPFTNRFVWNGASGSWSFEQSYIEDGAPRTFATKEMVRRG